MAEFYRQCKQKGYTDMTDDTQSLKAKVIASDLGLRYGDIATFFNKARKCNEEVERETAEAEAKRREQAALQQEQNRKLAVKGNLLLTFLDSNSETAQTKSVRVYRRPDNSVYYTLNNGAKNEGTPTINVEASQTMNLQYHPSQTVFTGATVGGVTTGGFHETKAYTTQSSYKTGNGVIKLTCQKTKLTVEKVIVSPEVCEAFHRDDSFRKYVGTGGEILCSKNSNSSMTQAALKSGDFNRTMSMLSVAIDQDRLPRDTCEAICNLLRRILRGDYPETDEQVYARAIKLSESASSDDVKTAIDLFKSISDYSDSLSLARNAKSRYEEVLQGEKEAAVLSRESNKRKARRIGIILTPIVIISIVLAIVMTTVIIPKQKLNKAMGMLDSGEYEMAYSLLEEIGNTDEITSSKYGRAVALLDSGDYEMAYSLLEEIGKVDEVVSSKYDRAAVLLSSGNYETAYSLLEEIGDNDAVTSSKFDRAVALLDSGDYDEANALLEEIGDSDVIALSKYDKAVAFIDSDNYFAAYMLLNGLSVNDSENMLNEMVHSAGWLKACPVGGIVYFGSYEQDNNTANGKEEIEWLVKAKEDDRILVISRYALDCKPYNEDWEDVTWETCELREWLNNSFLDSAFSSRERGLIPMVTVSADNNPNYSTTPGNRTMDQVFLLSITEANKYFSSDEARKCAPTAYAIAHGSVTYGSSTVDGSAAGFWWLRSPGGTSMIAAYVSDAGSVNYIGYYVYTDFVAIRPALWIDLES